MPWFMTVYNADGSEAPDPSGSLVGGYGGHLFASNFRQAEKIAKQRGLGEKVVGESQRAAPYKLPSRWLNGRTTKDKDAFHALCWFGHLALKSGAATVDDILGDRGLLHEWAHMRNFGGRSGVRRKSMVAMARAIEARIPGFRGDRDGK